MTIFGLNSPYVQNSRSALRRRHGFESRADARHDRDGGSIGHHQGPGSAPRGDAVSSRTKTDSNRDGRHARPSIRDSNRTIRRARHPGIGAHDASGDRRLLRPASQSQGRGLVGPVRRALSSRRCIVFGRLPARRGRPARRGVRDDDMVAGIDVSRSLSRGRVGRNTDARRQWADSLCGCTAEIRLLQEGFKRGSRRALLCPRRPAPIRHGSISRLRQPISMPDPGQALGRPMGRGFKCFDQGAGDGAPPTLNSAVYVLAAGRVGRWTYPCASGRAWSLPDASRHFGESERSHRMDRSSNPENIEESDNE